MERLWSPWRLAYVTGGTRGRLRVLPRPATGDAPLVVHRGATCFVILNLFPYNNGHLMVVPGVTSRHWPRRPPTNCTR